MSDVTFEGVTKRYGTASVIEDLNLHIDDHELMVLVGPSGCGKSTALRMIAGLEDVTGGTISIGGRIVNNLPPKDRDIAMVFQSYALYPHMSVRENLEFGLKMRHVERADMNRRVSSAAEILGITHLLDRKPKDLSGGQRQRVAVGRAIVREPAVFLFDEPLSNLDAKLRVQMRAEITRLQLTLGTTSVYVTHDQVEAMTMGHRIAVMRDGKIQQVGAPLEVYARPLNVFVAQFIGTPPMNLFRARVEDSTLRAAAFAIPIPDAARSLLTAGREVVVGIRPENLGGESKPMKGPTASISVTVDIVEPIGHESIVYATAAGERLVAIFDPQSAPKVAETIAMKIELDRMHLFDGATEQRIG
jgi:multiple sugar transport system ATP-binding protein